MDSWIDITGEKPGREPWVTGVTTDSLGEINLEIPGSDRQMSSGRKKEEGSRAGRDKLWRRILMWESE